MPSAKQCLLSELDTLIETADEIRLDLKRRLPESTSHQAMAANQRMIEASAKALVNRMAIVLAELAEAASSHDLDCDVVDQIKAATTNAFDEVTAEGWSRTREAAEDREAA